MLSGNRFGSRTTNTAIAFLSVVLILSTIACSKSSDSPIPSQVEGPALIDGDPIQPDNSSETDELKLALEVYISWNDLPDSEMPILAEAEGIRQILQEYRCLLCHNSFDNQVELDLGQFPYRWRDQELTDADKLSELLEVILGRLQDSVNPMPPAVLGMTVSDLGF
jgi:hypothetical protein